MATNPREIGTFTLTLAEHVRRERLRRRWKQEELSEKSSVHQGTISKIERGLMAVDMEQLEDIAHAFDMEAEDFIISARKDAGKPVETGDRYLPDGTVNPAIGRTAAVSDEHREELRRRKRS